MSAGPRPDRLVVVTGTGTEVGKTWWTAAVARDLRARGSAVAARKPVQSFAPTDALTALDASVLGAATGEPPETVCPTHRWLAEPMAPPMAAARLGLPPFTIADLVGELHWDAGTAIGFVEGAGGLRSPLADDGDTRTLIQSIRPDHVVVVADPALGVIHDVRLVVGALAQRSLVVALNRFDDHDPQHTASRDWLADRDGVDVVTSPSALVSRWS
ncbi:MAG: dethiobiotin synthase [Actinobacteria bacterium]|nr:dethiobiotin synthase [Actinomycetota bacterium]